MLIDIGDRFPPGLLHYYENGSAKSLHTNKIFRNKRILIFGMPGAFTPTCSNYHIPSIINQLDEFKKKLIDEVICLIVNDVYVAKTWSDQTGATKAGLRILTDPSGILVKKMGLAYNAPDVGFVNRSVRFCLLTQDGIINKIFTESERGKCEITNGNTVLNYLERLRDIS